MNLKLLSLKESVIDYLVSEIKGLSDLSKVGIIFPGHRPALFLNARLAETLKRPFEPPHTISFEDMILELAAAAGVEHRPVSAYELMNIVYNIIPESNKISKYKSRFSNFFSIYKKIVADYEQIVKGNSLSRLETVASDLLSGCQDLDDIKDYITVLHNLSEYITQNRCYTTADYYRIVSELPEEKLKECLLGFQKIYLVDLIPLYLTEIDLLERLSTLENVYFIYQASNYLNRFDLLKKRFDIPTQGEEVFDKSFKIYESQDIHGEILKLKEIIMDNPIYYKNSKPSTLIMLLDTGALKVLDSLLLCNLPNDSYNVSLGIPIAGSSLVSFINLIFDSLSSFHDIEGLAIKPFTTLIRHPIFLSIKGKNRKPISGYVEEIFDYLTGQVIDYIDIAELKGAGSLRAALEELDEPLSLIYDKLNTAVDIGGLAEYICNVVAYISTRSLHANYGLFQKEAEIIYSRFKDIAASPIRGIKICRSDLKSVFNSLISDLTMRPRGSPLSGLQVLGPYEARALSFENTFILDFNDENLFSYSADGSFIPEEIKRRLDLPSFISFDDYLCYFLDILLRQSKNVYLFYKSQNRLTKNRYLLNYIYQMRKRNNIDPPIYPIRYNIVIKPPLPREITKDEGMINLLKCINFTASLLNLYYNCPARFYYRVVVGLEVPEEVSDEPENLFLGIIVHEVLGKFFADYKQKNLKKGSRLDYRRMNNLLLRRMDERINYKNKKRLLYKAMMNIISDNLQQIQEELIGRAEKEYIILDTEREFKREVSISLKAEEIRVNLSGRVDRIEKIDDYINITDYKLARSSNYNIVRHYLSIAERRELGGKGWSIQPPFYVYLLKGSKDFGNTERISSRFIFLRTIDNPHNTTREIYYCSDGLPQIEDKKVLNLNICSDLIENLIKEVLDIDIPFPPIESDGCTYCEYFSICHKIV